MGSSFDTGNSSERGGMAGRDAAHSAASAASGATRTVAALSAGVLAPPLRLSEASEDQRTITNHGRQEAVSSNKNERVNEGDPIRNHTASAGHAADANKITKPLSETSGSQVNDLMRSTDMATTSTTARKETEDGSAQALLSLMESVRSSELKIAGHGLLAAAAVSPPRAPVLKSVPKKKTLREADPYNGGDSSSGERVEIVAGDASSDGGGGETPSTKPYKKRKSTHTVRKEEKATLLDEIKSLEDRLTFLRGQVFAPVRDSSGQVVKPGVSNAVLRQAIHEQQLRFASARSLISQSLTAELAAPLHTYLHLGPNPQERRAKLLALKQPTLDAGKRYIEERSRQLDLSKHHAVVERFETVSGDACCIRFYIDQFPVSLTSVKNVHDATSFFTSNLEMSITDSLGKITIREDDDSGDPSLSQHRLVVAGTQGIVVDVNSVVFSHYNEQENYGILATTYVDEDELHPYRPLERIRQDVTAVSLITQENDIVVVRRWAYICMRHSDHVVFPYGVLQTIRENLGIWGDAMMQFVRERLRMKAQAMGSS